MDIVTAPRESPINYADFHDAIGYALDNIGIPPDDLDRATDAAIVAVRELFREESERLLRHPAQQYDARRYLLAADALAKPEPALAPVEPEPRAVLDAIGGTS
jgi:hypothetical protein